MKKYENASYNEPKWNPLLKNMLDMELLFEKSWIRHC